MNLIQIKVDNALKEAIKKKAEMYGITASSLIRIVLVKSFLQDKMEPGNIFNAARDNNGKGVAIDDIISML